MTQNSINTAHTQLQSVTTSTASVVTCSTNIPYDDTIPQNTEGDEVLTLAITPTYSNSILEIWFDGLVTKDTNAGSVQVALFQDSTANALMAQAYMLTTNTTGRSDTASLRYYMTSGTTSSTTFKIRIGSAANTCFVNGDNAGNRLMGGVSSTRLTITEYI